MTGKARNTVTVLLADRQPMFCDALALALNHTADITVTATTDNAELALELDRTHHPAVVLTDSDLTDHSGVWLAARLTARRRNGPRIIMVTTHHEDRVLAGALAAGCVGFVGKDRPVAVLTDAIRAAARGEAIIHPRELTQLLTTLRSGYTGAYGSDLTPTEIDVLQLMADGLTPKQIAATLHLSYITIRNYVQAILGKLDTHSQGEAVAAALRGGVINLDHPTT